MTVINGTEYEEQELDGNTILVPVKKKKVSIKLTQRQVDALFDIMGVVAPIVYTGNDGPRWFDGDYGQWCEFSDRANDVAKEIYEMLQDDATRESEWNPLSDKIEKHFVLIEEKRKKP